jgi:hypothetical protein
MADPMAAVLAPSQFRTKETGVAKRAGPVSLVRFVLGKSLIMQRALAVNGCQDRHLTAVPIQSAWDARFAQRKP